MAEHTAERKNPYLGPRPFEPNEELYGRDAEALDLLDLLLAERIVLLHSASGAGKTSLIQAGLLRRLESEGFAVPPVLRVNPQTVRAELEVGAAPNRYVMSLLLQFEQTLPEPERRKESELARMTLANWLDTNWKTGTAHRPQLLIFDQFEEILTVDPADQKAKDEFFAQLGAVLRDRERWALFSMREEYVGALDPFLPRIPTRLAHRFHLDPLGPDAARRAIQGLADQGGVRFLDEAAELLVNNLRMVRNQLPDGTTVEQPGPFVEPVQLQVVCRQVWDHLPDAADEVTPQSIEELGHVDDALGDYYAESVRDAAEKTGVEERAIRRWVARHLIVDQGSQRIRGQVPQGPKESDGLDNRAIRRLVDAFVVRGENRGGRTWFELAHDRLIEPVTTNNERWFEQHLSLLQREAERWDRLGRPSGLLLYGPALAGAEKWARRNPPTGVERALLDLSIQQRRQAALRRLWVGALLGIPLIGGCTLFGVRVGRDRTQSEALSGIAEVNKKTHFDLSLLLSTEASDVRWGRAGDDKLRELIGLHPTLVSFLWGHQEKQVNVVAWRPDGKMIASAGNDGVIGLWDARTRLPLPESPHPPGRDCHVRGTAFSDDGRWLAACVDTRHVLLLDGRAPWKEVSELSLPDFNPSCLAFSHDGRRLGVGTDEGQVLLLRVGTAGSLIQDRGLDLLNQEKSQVNSVAFSPDGRWLTAANNGGRVVLWELASRHVRWSHLRRREINAVVFTHDSAHLLSGGNDGAVVLWDVEGDGAPSKIAVSERGVNTLAFDFAGARLASGDDDGNLVIRNTDDWRTLGSARHPNGVALYSVAWNPDGREIVGCYDDGTLLLWDTSPKPAALPGDSQGLEERACRIANRNLTSTEWTEYMQPLFGSNPPYRRTCPMLPEGKPEFMPIAADGQ